MAATTRAKIVVRHHDEQGKAVENPWPIRHCPLVEYIREGDGVLDLGANVGEFARCFAEKVGPSGLVVAVEADQYNAMVCAHLAEPYRWLHVVPAAVSDEAGLIKLYRDAKNARRQSLWYANLTSRSDDWMFVPALTLDQLASQVPNLRGIKVDIQGAEGSMLAGGGETLQRTDLTWYVELWALGLENAGSHIEIVVQTFKHYGWQIAERYVGYERKVDSETNWDATLKLAKDRPQGVQNVILRHSSTPQN